MKANIRRFLYIVLFSLFFSGCGWLWPWKTDVSSWFSTPDVGSVYTYQVVTVYQDTSETSETITLEVVDAYSSGDLDYVKFLNTQTEESIFYIVDNAAEELYYSRDASIDESDYLVLKAPVEERAEWVFETGSYEISLVNGSESFGDGRVRDVIEVEASFDDVEAADLVIR